MKPYNVLALSGLILFGACSTNDPDIDTGKKDDPTPKPDVEESGFVFTINADKKVSTISPFIYGMNLKKEYTHSPEDFATLVRLGGNRTTGYNWENNASNAGSDWKHSSDNNMPSNIIGSDTNVPGSVAATFIANCLNNNQSPLFTIPMCYSVAADKKGEVAEGDDSRWIPNLPVKPTPFSAVPDLTDGAVYADECVNFVSNVCGAKGKVAYALDNEPDLWHSTHPRICKEHISCVDFLDRTIKFATAIKNVDKDADIYGFASFGYSGYSTFSGAPDWSYVKGNYSWFLDYYLDHVRKASEAYGSPLVDVLDLHWYPEAKGDNRITYDTSNTINDKKARLQAPRSLWDETYKETSWITQQSNYRLPLIPNVMKSINKYAPGTKLAFMEFNYGGYEDITGAIALTDVLGVLGKYGVHAAAHWGYPGSYGCQAYYLYRNYDGQGGKYGETLVESSINKTWVNSSVYSSLSADDGCLHTIVTNKSFDDSIDGKFRINSTRKFKKATVYYIDDTAARINKGIEIAISDNRFNYSIPPLCAVHLVIE